MKTGTKRTAAKSIANWDSLSRFLSSLSRRVNDDEESGSGSGSGSGAKARAGTCRCIIYRRKDLDYQYPFDKEREEGGRSMYRLTHVHRTVDNAC